MVCNHVMTVKTGGRVTQNMDQVWERHIGTLALQDPLPEITVEQKCFCGPPKGLVPSLRKAERDLKLTIFWVVGSCRKISLRSSGYIQEGNTSTSQVGPSNGQDESAFWVETCCGCKP